MKRHITTLFLSLFVLTGMKGQHSVRLELPNHEQLSSERVLQVMQDSEGFLWYATQGGGVCRDDGRLMIVFRSDAEHPDLLVPNDLHLQFSQTQDEQMDAEFDADHPAPGKLATAISGHKAAVGAENAAYIIARGSELTEQSTSSKDTTSFAASFLSLQPVTASSAAKATKTITFFIFKSV